MANPAVRLGELIAIVTGGLVAMMAVGYENRLGVHDRGQLRNDLHVADWPKSVNDFQMIGSFERRHLGD